MLDSVSCPDLLNQNIVTYENFNPADWLEILDLNDEEKITYIIGVYLMKSQSYQMSVREKSFIRYLKKALKLSLDS